MKKLGIEILKEIYATLFEAVDDVMNLDNEYPMVAKPISIAIGTLDEAIETDDDSPFWESLNHPIVEKAVGGALAIIGAVHDGDIEIEEPKMAKK